MQPARMLLQINRPVADMETGRRSNADPLGDTNEEFTTMSIYPNGDAAATSTVRGRTLAHQQWNPRKRAFTAADLVTGRIALTDPTVLQAAALCKVSQPYVAAALKVADRVARAKIVAGHLPLIEAGSSAPKMLAKPTPLFSAWAAASPDERLALADTVGVDVLWDSCIQPAIS